MQAPTIKTASLTLSGPRVHHKMDVSHYLKWLNDSTVVRYSEQRHQKHTRESQYIYLRTLLEGDDFFWDIMLDDQPIGAITAICDLPNKTANVGIMIGDLRYWGRGHACEAYEAVCDFLFDEGFRKVEGGTMANNGAMIAIFMKLGFTQEGIIRDHFLFEGQPKDMYLYGKFRQAKIVAFKKAQAEPPSPK